MHGVGGFWVLCYQKVAIEIKYWSAQLITFHTNVTLLRKLDHFPRTYCLWICKKLSSSTGATHVKTGLATVSFSLDFHLTIILSSFFFPILAQPIHWNYKTADLDDFLKDKEEVAFLDPSRNPFYCIQTGKHSCYGDQSRTILKSLVEFEGNYYLNMIGLE